VGVLPVYLWTYDALPPGSWYLKSTDVSARVGPFLSYELLAKMSEGLPRSTAERLVIALSQRTIEGMRDDEDIRVEDYVEELRKKALSERPARQSVTVQKGS
jgi:hypothetical protein